MGIERDAPLTEIFVVRPGGEKTRVYYGTNQAHINWKLNRYRKKQLEVVEYLVDAGRDEQFITDMTAEPPAEDEQNF